MLLRKILINLFAAIFTPVVMMVNWLPNVFKAVFYQRYEYFDFRINSLSEMLYNVYGRTYIPIVVVSLLLIFLPLQLIKNQYQKSKKLTFSKRWMLLTLIVLFWVVFTGTFTNIWGFPLYKNLIYVVYAGGFSLIFTAFFHYTLDRYERKIRLDKTKNDDVEIS